MPSRLLPVLLLTLAAVGPTASFGQSALAAREFATRTHLADRQRVLSQRMAKAACLMAQGVTVSEARAQLVADHAAFGAADRALRRGSDETGLDADPSQDVQRALTRIDGSWSTLAGAVEDGLAAGRFDPADLARLDRASLELLSGMEAAAETIERVHARRAGTDLVGQSLTQDLAERQPMLAERAVKELCLVQAGQDRAVQAKRLGETAGMFDMSLTALRFGFPNAGIEPPASEALRIKLSEVARQWGPIKALMDRAAAGDTLTDRELEGVVRQSEILLQDMRDALRLYGG